jgi:hypothetical protein
MDKYPEIDDQDFQFLIAQRLEFRDLRNIDGLYPHQEFVRRFMSPYTPYKSLIVYHTLGSGKSIACIAVAVDHYLYDGKRCIIVTKGDTGTSNFVKQIKMYHDMCSSRNRWDASAFHMRHYISLSNQINSMSDDDVTRAFSNVVLVLDEVHNVRYLKRAAESSVYGSIIRLLKLCANVRLLIATATPMTDSPDQINSIMGMCNYNDKDRSMPLNGIVSYNSAMRDVPRYTKVGTTEYVPDMCVYPSYMREHQEREYLREYGKQPPDDIYRKLTHISLFCFSDGTYGKEVTDTKMTKTRVKTLIMSMSTKQTKEIKYTKYGVLPEFWDELCGDGLRNSSSKYAAVVDLLDESEGTVFVFIEEVKGSGLLLLASVLEQHGYELYIGEDIDNLPMGKRYTMCVGSSDISPNNNDRLDGFNSDLNKNGEYVKVLLGSKVIGESITLKNVRSFYCLTPHWNDSTVDQAIGRVVRNGSHLALDEDQRKVDIYIHVSIYRNDPHSSVDIKKLERCKDKEAKIKEVEKMMIDCAVDRYINDAGVPITYSANYAAAYLHNIRADIASSVERYFVAAGWRRSSVRSIASYTGLDTLVCEEALCRMILSNVCIGGHMFLRAYEDTVFAVNDPSLPYVMVPDAVFDYQAYHHVPMHLDGSPSFAGASSSADDGQPADDERFAVAPDRTAYCTECVALSIVKYPGKGIGKEGECMGSDGRINLAVFRYMHVKHKIACLEHCIERGMFDALSPVNTLYANIDETVCHLLMYRDVESSYSGSTPVPKVPLKKTRVFYDGTWSNVATVEEERHLLNQYRVYVNDLLAEADQAYPIYGLISTIDGDMRLRLRSTEDRGKSSNDNRYVKRGRSMKSIKKSVLLDILSSIEGERAQDNITITEAVQKIDGALVNAGLYVVL